MAEKGVILSVDEEQKLLKPIDEYVGKIQKQIDSLRADGSDKVRSLKNHMAIVKENKNLTKEEKAKIAGKGFPALCFLSCDFRYSVFSLILFWNRFRI